MSVQANSLIPGDKVTCRLCGRQFAKYNCSTCNVAYCSLTCFRSEAHSQCSETFYRKEIEREIQSEPSKTPQERMQMMGLLKKFEEENQQGASGGLESDDDDDGEDLAERFQGIDLESASAADLWSKLKPAEQEQFLKLMEDPASGLAQQLLASEELENERREPWWDAPLVETQEISPARRYGTKPDVINVPAAMVQPISKGPPLCYNMCALCIAYAFTTRHFSVSPLSTLRPEDVDFEEARSVISQLVPFLTDRNSKTLYSNLSSLTTDIWSRFKPGQINSELFALLLRDTAHLLRPLPVTILPTESPQAQGDFDTSSHPHRDTVLVVSDLTKLFEIRADGTWKLNYVTHKLLFYAAHILSIPSPILRALSAELLEKATTYEVRGADDVAIKAESGPVADRRKPEARTAIIEEI
ncbi:hypothetical protein D9615_003582 [Tricholomella constricta]|uniref:HIT-type domain-containing protein n=1 Tax=Tricholomella constricta TaxID=117010 RepID=A0A8H5HI90_9AGAR|nr:hypothetical protein D9615_003582 [Tricholomella constricta]